MNPQAQLLKAEFVGEGVPRGQMYRRGCRNSSSKGVWLGLSRPAEEWSGRRHVGLECQSSHSRSGGWWVVGGSVVCAAVLSVHAGGVAEWYEAWRILAIRHLFANSEHHFGLPH